MSTTHTLQYFSELLPDSKVINTDSPASIQLKSVASISDVGTSDAITFINSKKLVKTLEESAAGAVLVTPELADQIQKPGLVVKNVEYSLIQIMQVLYPETEYAPAISERADIHASAKIGADSHVESFVFVGENSSIGANSVVHSSVHIGRNVSIGAQARIGANTVIHDGTVIGDNFICSGNCTLGAEGFKFVPQGGVMHKFPHLGKVIVGDNVEMGANCTVDRGGLSNTLIGDGCKFDNMVHVGHNCELGKNVVIAGQSGVAGSTKIGDNCMISGHCAFQDHITIAPGSMFGGQTAIRNDVKEGGVYAGSLGLSAGDFQKLRVNIKHVINFRKWGDRVSKLEAQVLNGSQS